MPAEVTIVLDTGAFLSENPLEVKVGYFETTGSTDIEVRENGSLKPGDTKLGRNGRVNVQHLAADGSPYTAITFSRKFGDELLRKQELYETDVPEFNEKAYHCVLHFESGDFDTTGAKQRWFKECDAASGAYTGKNHHTKKRIAQDVLVTYNLKDDEELRLQRDDKTVLWSSGKVVTGSPAFEVTLLADRDNGSAYFNEALELKGKTCWLPNPDPPPVGAP